MPFLADVHRHAWRLSRISQAQADDRGYFCDPGKSTREKGARILEATVAGLAAYLEAFAQTPLRLGIARDPHKSRISPPLPLSGVRAR